MKINHKIIVAGIICLTMLNMFLIVYDHDSQAITMTTVGIIGVAIGVVVVPSPKIDNKRGYLKW